MSDAPDPLDALLARLEPSGVEHLAAIEDEAMAHSIVLRELLIATTEALVARQSYMVAELLLASAHDRRKVESLLQALNAAKGADGGAKQP